LEKKPDKPPVLEKKLHKPPVCEKKIDKGHIAVGHTLWTTPVGVQRWVALVAIKTSTERRSLVHGDVLLSAPTVIALQQAKARIGACLSLSALPTDVVKGPAVLEYHVIACQ